MKYSMSFAKASIAFTINAIVVALLARDTLSIQL